MNVMITGSKGQLGSQLVELGLPGADIFDYDLDMDITDSSAVKKEFLKVKPGLVIHCAAYTDVDGCEQKKELCYKVNTEGTLKLAKEAKKHDSDFLFLSTDYVFDGTKKIPYVETDRPHPISVYGDSKYKAEKIIRGLLDNYYIVRTTGIYSRFGKNFVDTILKGAETSQKLCIVDDQVCTPTYSLDLARCIKELVSSKRFGIYHATNQGQCTWYHFTKRIFELMGVDTRLMPICSSKLNRKAKRPAYSVLDNHNLEANQIFFMRSWEEALKDFLKKDYGK